MDCIVHRITKSQTLQSDFHFLFTELKGSKPANSLISELWDNLLLSPSHLVFGALLRHP